MGVLKVKFAPNRRAREVYRTVALSTSCTFDDLCGYILDLFDFDDTAHLYEFILGTSRHSERLRMEDCGITLESLGFLPKKFFLHFDFGDDWYFSITIMQGNVSLPEGIECKLLTSKGKISQYPDWDEDEDEDDEEDEE